MDLLQRFSEGDLEAFEVLFRQYQARVYTWIVRMVRDVAVAEDLTLETFWRIYRARGSFDPAKDFGGWAYRIATNMALTYIRRRRPALEIPPDLPDGNGRLHDPAIDQEMRQGIRRAFTRLPANLQAVATLALIEERPYQEIAETLGIATGTVKSRVFRAVRLLRKQLKRMRVHT